MSVHNPAYRHPYLSFKLHQQESFTCSMVRQSIRQPKKCFMWAMGKYCRVLTPYVVQSTTTIWLAQDSVQWSGPTSMYEIATTSVLYGPSAG